MRRGCGSPYVPSTIFCPPAPVERLFWRCACPSCLSFQNVHFPATRIDLVRK